MRVLSLFDGISCGQIAIKNSQIPVEDYMASEINSDAMNVTNFNFPDTKQLGNVESIDFGSIGPIDLLLAGSPCQGFSRGGQRLGIKDPRSSLYYKFLEALKILKPTWFLLENTLMGDFKDNISRDLGCKPYLVDSRDFSCQNRKRLYWTNRSFNPQYQDVKLSDILTEEYLPSKNPPQWVKDIIQQNQVNIPSVCIIQKPRGKNEGGLKALDGKVPCLTSSSWVYNNYLYYRGTCRTFTRGEIERMQTLPTDYTHPVAKTKAFNLIGNAWTVKVIQSFFN